MGSSKTEQIWPSITESSSLSQLLSVIRCSFEERVQEVERILSQREEDSKMEVIRLKAEVESLRKERDLLEKNHGLVVLQCLEMEEVLEKLRLECEELRDKVNMMTEDHYLLVDRKVEAVEMFENLKIESPEKETQRLRTENERLRKEIEDYRSKLPECHDRVSSIEEKLAEFLQIDVSNVRKGNVEHHSPDGIRKRKMEDHSTNGTSPNLKRSNVEVEDHIPDMTSPYLSIGKDSDHIVDRTTSRFHSSINPEDLCRSWSEGAVAGGDTAETDCMDMTEHLSVDGCNDNANGTSSRIRSSSKQTEIRNSPLNGQRGAAKHVII